ncbi:MAG: amylo-alpha-1,6-glucosidase [Pseudomonadota bacterium]
MNDQIQLSEEQSFEIIAEGTGSITEGKRVLNHSNTFGVFNTHGDIGTRRNESLQGIYHKGTRFINKLQLRLNGQCPVLLGSTIKEQNEMLAVDLTNSQMTDSAGNIIPHGRVHLLRSKFIRDGGCYEEIAFANYHSEPVSLELSVELDADFKDIFELRGATRTARGKISLDGPQLAYTGLDNIKRWLEVESHPRNQAGDSRRILYKIKLAPNEKHRIQYALKFHIDNEMAPNSYEAAKLKLIDDLSYHKEVMAGVRASNEQFTHWLNRSRTDLISLLANTDAGYRYPYAGVPWFNTAFGRDGILTAYETLWLAPAISRDVLLFLAANQATETDPTRDAEPGKILHEMRDGEMANTNEIPFRKYYGTIDATPLFIVLAGAYYLRTNDLKTIEKLWPNIERALSWIDEYGDTDKDGFVEYAQKAHNGLNNQGWKDSDDCISHANGELAQSPITLCEVQAYVYDAKQKAAMMAEALGKSVLAVQLQKQADTLKEKFNATFWDEELQCFVLALDRDKKPCRVKSSNAGQCLLSGIVDKSKAAGLAKTMLSEEMFSGWGIRTLASDAPRYNPMSYHNGSVWPHDVALIAAGLARYGFKDEVLKIMAGLFDASLFIEFQRLPELFCGFARRKGEGPTDYPVACSPQAWSVASVFMMLQACLCMEIDATRRVITFHNPQLPEYLNYVLISDLSIGSRRDISIEIYRYATDVGINITGKPDDWNVIIYK